jgi:hypothetical protein
VTSSTELNRYSGPSQQGSPLSRKRVVIEPRVIGQRVHVNAKPCCRARLSRLASAYTQRHQEDPMGTEQTALVKKEHLLITAATRRLVEDVPAIELWDAWVFAEVDTDLALDTWYRAHDSEKRDAYAAYVAALDREEQAATTLAERLGAT